MHQSIFGTSDTLVAYQKKLKYLTDDDLDDINQGCDLYHCYE